MKRNLAILISALLASQAFAQPQNKAQQIFERYQALERSFDPAVADLYCSTALIRNTRTYPNGTQRALELPVGKYQEVIRATMPLAKAKGDYSTYSSVVYTPEGSGVRVTASRYSVLKQYTSPVSLLIGPCNGGDWAILEELSQSQP